MKQALEAPSQTTSSQAGWLDRVIGWLLPIHPAVGLLAVVGLSTRGKNVVGGLRRHPEDVRIWLLLALSGIISVAGAYNRAQALLESFIPFLFIWLYALGRWGIIAPQDFLRAFLRGTGFLALIMVLARLFQWEWYLGDFPVLARFIGARARGQVLGVYSNGLAMVVEAGVVGGLIMVLTARERLQKLEAGLVAALCLAAVLITLSRGALVGIVVGVVVTGLLSTPRIIPAFGVGLAIPLLSCPILGQRVRSIIDMSESGANAERLDIWRGTLELIRDHLWFGVGPGNFGQVYPSYSVSQEVARFVTPHSTYLYILSGWGLVGGLIIFGWITWVMVRALLAKLNPYQKAIWVILVTFGVHILFDDLMSPHIPLLLGCLENENFQAQS